MTFAYNQDCMTAMKEFPDKYFELAIVDPPYGIGQNKNNGKSIGLRKKWVGYDKKKYTVKNWDDSAPAADFFTELFRVSTNQIIWGSNHFELPPSRGIIAWDKICDGTGFSNFELAWSSFDKSAKIFRLAIQAESQIRIHPTQKPTKLYRWLLTNYAKQGDKILDTHLGSGSSRIAAHQLGFEFYGYELDKDYFEAQEKRFKLVTSQEQIQFPKSA